MDEFPSVPVFDDDRGRLIPVEFNTLPFVPRRCFVVTAPGRPSYRGGHRADCNEAVILLRGSVALQLQRGDLAIEHHLHEAGAGSLIAFGDFVKYHLETADSEILVLADQPYPGRSA